MNPLTLVKRIKEINSKEAALGISESASWHSKYKESPYVFVGGIPFDLTEGDVLAIFSQYGEIVDVNLVRDKGTGKSKGYAFVAYVDQRSTNLAVDNLNGANIAGRIIRVDHVADYKKKEEEDEEMEQQKREARGVCRAFQRGDCNRGASCKFSHNEQRAANTGWGPKDDIPKWGHDKHEAPPIKSGRMGGNSSSRLGDSHDQENNIHSDDKGKRLSRAEDDRASYPKRREMNHDRRGAEKPSKISEKEPRLKDSDRQAERRDDRDRGRRDDRSFRYESDQKSKENHDRKEGSGRYTSEPNLREDCGGKGREDRSGRHESHRKPSEDHDRKEKSGRKESEPKPREGRDKTGREDRSGRRESERNNIGGYDQRDAIKRSRYDEDELQARRARR